MGLVHESLPVHGVQFHPESIASEHGHLMLKNFLDLAAAWNARAAASRAPLRRANRPRTPPDRGSNMADDFKALIAKVATGASLTRAEAASAFDRMMSGEATPSQMGALLMALRVRGETVDEITGAVTTMRAKMLAREGAGRRDRRGRHRRRRLRLVQHLDLRRLHRRGRRRAGRQARQPRAVVEVGRRRRAAARSASRSTSTPNRSARCIREAGIGFMFAPAHHPAMKNVGPTRVELGTRTIFNLLGPLSNPASVKRQMIGTFSKHWVEPMAQVLKNLGSECVWVVHGSDGLDEITTAGPTSVAALENGKIRTFEITPEDAGLQRVKPEALRGGDAEQNAKALLDVLKGKARPFRDVAILNAAAALIVAGKAKDLKEGAALAAKSIDSGEAEGRLDRLIAVSNAVEA